MNSDDERPRTSYTDANGVERPLRQLATDPYYGRGFQRYLSNAAFEEMRDSQGNACAICRITFDDLLVLPCVDHDHEAERSGVPRHQTVRGLLCRMCNLAIGNMKDDPARLRSAADYLDAHALSVSFGRSVVPEPGLPVGRKRGRPRKR